eukprot:NODE_4856_length_622_cov_46.605585_g4180_i0.p2 GENE.NODE_4856_length_622_cov_46.605585_g4180_i0~~NODE_4856_length_622_cov_46.605585_g4180_i0.p2  ORF type:complete len:173 (+),score=25.96 NODE_4856_length_622_cov_46.605585_g4180_i0:24-521(+)
MGTRQSASRKGSIMDTPPQPRPLFPSREPELPTSRRGSAALLKHNAPSQQLNPTGASTDILLSMDLSTPTRDADKSKGTAQNVLIDALEAESGGDGSSGSPTNRQSLPGSTESPPSPSFRPNVVRNGSFAGAPSSPTIANLRRGADPRHEVSPLRKRIVSKKLNN